MNTVTTMNTAVKTASVSLVVDNTKPLTMSSRQIAEFTGKEHKNVKADIVKMFKALELDALKSQRIYFDQYGREQTEYHLDEEIKLRGENIAIKFMRKFYPYYLAGFKNAKILRSKLVVEESYDNIIKLINSLRFVNT